MLEIKIYQLKMTKRSIVILNPSDEESLSTAKIKYNMLPSTPQL